MEAATKYIYEGELNHWYSEDGSTCHQPGLTLTTTNEDQSFSFIQLNECFLERLGFSMQDEKVLHLDHDGSSISYRLKRWKNMRITIEQREEPGEHEADNE